MAKDGPTFSQIDKRLHKVQATFARCVEKCEAWDIPISQNIVLKKEIAETENWYAITVWDNTTETYTITVSALVWYEYADKNLSEALRNIVFHELCHTCPRSFNHKGQWKHWVCLLNKEHGCKINPFPYSVKETSLY